MDCGVPGVAKSRTRLNDFNFHCDFKTSLSCGIKIAKDKPEGLLPFRTEKICFKNTKTRGKIQCLN